MSPAQVAHTTLVTGRFGVVDAIHNGTGAASILRLSDGQHLLRLEDEGGRNYALPADLDLDQFRFSACSIFISGVLSHYTSLSDRIRALTRERLDPDRRCVAAGRHR